VLRVDSVLDVDHVDHRREGRTESSSPSALPRSDRLVVGDGPVGVDRLGVFLAHLLTFSPLANTPSVWSRTAVSVPRRDSSSVYASGAQSLSWKRKSVGPNRR
jgi:hypothetical protein